MRRRSRRATYSSGRSHLPLTRTVPCHMTFDAVQSEAPFRQRTEAKLSRHDPLAFRQSVYVQFPRRGQVVHECVRGVIQHDALQGRFVFRARMWMRELLDFESLEVLTWSGQARPDWPRISNIALGRSIFSPKFAPMIWEVAESPARVRHRETEACHLCGRRAP